MKKWFETWFDTAYYHMLYQERNTVEANLFIENLITKLDIPKEAIFLDIACGSGRHTKHIAKKGYQVHGIDLSKNSINKAKENNNIKFKVHDMRKPYIENYFNVVLNLFTSFGYFETKTDNKQAIFSMVKNLKKEGFFIIDFMNVKKVISNLIPEEIKSVNSIKFHIKRKFENEQIKKDISFQINQKKYHYQEKIYALTLVDFSDYLQKAEMSIVNLWGDYNLNDFNVKNSDRLIIMAKRC